MQVDKEKLVHTLVMVRVVEEQIGVYCQDAQQIPVPWQHVLTAVEACTGCAIQVVRPTEAEILNLKGTMIRWDDGFVAIVLRPRMTAEDQNLTIVKEAMHPLIDKETDWSSDTDATIELLFKSEVFGVGNGENDHVPVVQSEHLALIAACAILVPARIRERIRAEIASKKTSVAKEALELGVPEHVVSVAISDTIMEYTKLAAGQSLPA